MFVLALTGLAHASIDPRCADVVVPDDYDEQAQQDFLANVVSLATSFSAIHSPIPHEPGHGAIGVDLNVIPPLGCKRRLVLQGTKTEDTNKTPIAPRIRLSFALPRVAGRFVPYASLAYLPPVPLLGTTNVIVSGEVGVGMNVGEHVELGLRYHFSLQKTVGEIATPFAEGDTPAKDVYLGSTLGADAMVGLVFGGVEPFLALGVTDVSTFFYIGDDGVVTNNLHPYLGPTASLGVEGLAWKRVRLGGELYVAPGGHSRPVEGTSSVKGFGRYGNLVTGRLRLAIEL